jgi:deoxyribodipyrimidine photolyase-like uncharacterized protein
MGRSIVPTPHPLDGELVGWREKTDNCGDHSCLSASAVCGAPSDSIRSCVALIEDPLFFGTDPSWPIKVHCQRLLLHRLSMAAYADDLRNKGFSVQVQRHDSAVDTNGHLGLLHAAGYRRFHVADPVDHLLEKRLKAFIDENNCHLEVVDTPLLLTPQLG